MDIVWLIYHIRDEDWVWDMREQDGQVACFSCEKDARKWYLKGGKPLDLVEFTPVHVIREN